MVVVAVEVDPITHLEVGVGTTWVAADEVTWAAAVEEEVATVADPVAVAVEAASRVDPVVEGVREVEAAIVANHTFNPFGTNKKVVTFTL